jgi:hypothetical protein
MKDLRECLDCCMEREIQTRSYWNMAGRRRLDENVTWAGMVAVETVHRW